MNLRIGTTLLAALLAALSLASAAHPPSLPGIWKATGDLPDGGTNDSTLTISQEGDGYRATTVGDDGRERNIDRIRIDDEKVVLELDVERDNQKGIIRVIAEETEPGQLAGKWYLLDADGEERAAAPWKAARLSQPEEKATDISLVGKWNGKATTGDGQEMLSVVTFSKGDQGLTGKSVSERGETAFESVEQDEKVVTIDMTLDINGNELEVRIEAALKDPHHLDGKWVIFDDTGQQAATGPWEAKRILPFELAGTWDVVAATDDGEHEHEAVFERTDDGYKGKAHGDFGTSEFTSVEVSGDAVSLVIPFGEGTIKIKASPEGTGKLKGKWTLFDSSDNETASNDWVATRLEATAKKEEEKPAPGVTGEWALTVKLGENEREYSLRIQEADDKTLKGTLISPRSGEHPADSVTFQDGELTVQVTRDIQGNEIPFIYKGKLQDEDTLSGSFVPEGYEDEFSGEWTGKRKAD